jgi:hypothetical protein
MYFPFQKTSPSKSSTLLWEFLVAMDERIAQIEARMTDTQDVMIALSEKLDRIDDRAVKGDES